MIVVGGAEIGASMMSARSATSGDIPNPVPNRIIIGGASGRFQPRAQIGVAGAAFGARGGVYDQRARAGDSRRLGDRVVEFRDDLHSLERLAPARIVGAAEVEAPVIDHARGEFPLLGNRMHDEHAAHVVGSRRARDIVDVEAGDRRGDGLGVAIDDRMMNQRYEEVATLSELAPLEQVGTPPRGAPF